MQSWEEQLSTSLLCVPGSERSPLWPEHVGEGQEERPGTLGEASQSTRKGLYFMLGG